MTRSALTTRHRAVTPQSHHNSVAPGDDTDTKRLLVLPESVECRVFCFCPPKGGFGIVGKAKLGLAMAKQKYMRPRL